MKLILYEPAEEGYVTTDPYDWEYTGRFDEVTEYLKSEPQLMEGVSSPEGEGDVELTGEDYLRRLSGEVKNRGIYFTEIVE